jgi:mono/diheme cytochrome c family protein
MIRIVFPLIGSLVLVAMALTVPTSTASNNQIAHGKYLVLHVAMCVQCHTPRNERGELISSRLLQGSSVPVPSPFPSQPWAFEAPKIAGLPGGWTEADLIQLLQTGKRPGGNSPRPPMPPFRMNREDAAAVAAYLKSLQ